jgi:hypothetical protein
MTSFESTEVKPDVLREQMHCIINNFKEVIDYVTLFHRKIILQLMLNNILYFGWQMGINCLALDFDQTLITEHTRGKFAGDQTNISHI